MKNICTRFCISTFAAMISLAAVAQVVERPRPAGWENLVPGGRFMDRFEPASVIVNDRKPCQAMLYRAKEIGGPWTCERMQFDLDGKTMIEGESNFSFCSRPDGSVLAVCRGGGIWLSEDGLKPFVRKSEGRVYPDVAGRFEDPVLWRGREGDRHCQGGRRPCRDIPAGRA